MKYPQNEKQSINAINEYEEFIAKQGKCDLRINLDDERDGEILVSQVDACYFSGTSLGDQIMLTDMHFTEGADDEDEELHINKITLPVALLEKVLKVIKAYKE